MEVRLRLAHVFVRPFPKLSADVGEGLCEKATGGSSSGMAQRLIGGTKPAHVDPSFASNRDWFRLKREGEFLLCVAVERKTHLLTSSVTSGNLTAPLLLRLFLSRRSISSGASWTLT